MSSKPEQKGTEEQTGRVKMGDLPRREEELSDEEAKKIKGTGGAPGGVVNIRKPGVNDSLVNFGAAPTPEPTGGKGGMTGEF